jgi:hypothetical protein
MRGNRSLIFILFMVCAILISGCGINVQRGSLTVDKALIGHWINSNGTPDYYFSAAGLTKVQKDGSTTNMTYVVLKSNDNENTISIRVSNPNGVVQDEDIKFTTDKKSMTETITILGVNLSEANYNYVDSKTKP